MTSAELQTALRTGRRVYGTCVVSPSPLWPRAMAGAGVDFVFIDTEHIPIERTQLAWMCQTYGALGLPPIVRVPEPDPYRACMALDGGAAGVVFPYVESVSQVRELCGAVKLRPLKGERMQRALAGDPLEPELRDYLAKWNEGRMAIVNVESVPAVERLEEILGVPGLDAVLIGPHDLSLSMGIPERYRDPAFGETVVSIIQKARARNIGAGLHYSFGIEEHIEWARKGANLIVHSSDLVLARDALAADMDRFRNSLGDTPDTARRSTAEAI
ncbi:MAG TPA: aldolase/citrate lyase family protein [Candidatus Hydrogenedentes bacterium]|nr:aldolase/citrate lyase family protein [Candidatus Hydrogenedentota bacterium]HRT19844.1 aldolase/citrate lyase family protein [Candidatus Hydrogenedentota bacterium]HRT65424.1 aldolase/citrate lyase family protein [Candidatus Hydrogenedentota bacterium]